MHAEDWLLFFIAIILPPIPVVVKRGFCSAECLISIVLLILGFLPSLIYAWYIISKYPKPEYTVVYEEERITPGYGAV